MPDGQAEHADRSQTGHQHLAAFADQELARPDELEGELRVVDLDGDEEGAGAGEGAAGDPSKALHCGLHG
ncbi:hypothetical protein [Micropruina glycogenica]|uniref:hypothetical protein n=1 Tax=Micropruina glycogenica TaxID=75385 RepID=UPI0031E10F46